jgi:hypothetical protein
MRLYTALLLALVVGLAGCNDDEIEEDDSDLDPDVEVPAYPILEREKSLHLFSVEAFGQDPNIFADRMELFIDNFTEAASTEEPDEDKDEDLSRNDLGYTRLIWSEIANEEKTALLSPMLWYLDNAPLLDSRFTNNDRPYRILEKGVLSATYESDYKPLYEVIDDNIYERHQSVVFVWDFGGANGVESEEVVAGDELADWESKTIGGTIYPILPHATIWGQDVDFTSGAMIIGGTRSVAREIIVIEAVRGDSGYSLTTARFATGDVAVDTVLESHNLASEPLDFRFSVDFFTQRLIHIQFDTVVKKAYLYLANGAPLADKVEVDYIAHPEEFWIELNTSALPKSALEGLGLPAYFHPVIAGPFGDTRDYYYGKRYIKTEGAARLKLDPVFFLNATAKKDVENAFREWRVDRHEEEE